MTIFDSAITSIEEISFHLPFIIKASKIKRG